MITLRKALQMNDGLCEHNFLKDSQIFHQKKEAKQKQLSVYSLIKDHLFDLFLKISQKGSMLHVSDLNPVQ